MTTTTSVLHGAALVDFTGSVQEYRSLSQFNDEFTKLIRGANRPKAVVVLDKAIGIPLEAPVLVRDHLNLTGHSPLCGPNDDCGDRFPVVQGVYIDDVLPKLRRVVLAGLRQGQVPNREEIELIESFGADVCSWNVVPSMLIAAHAKCKVLALVLPEQGTLTSDVAEELRKLTGGQA